MKLKLTARFLLILVAIGLVPLGILAFISLHSASKLVDGAGDRLQTTAVQTLNTIERNLFERYGDVQAFATNKILQANDFASPEAGPAFTEAINTYIRLYGIYSLSMIVDATGKCVAVNTLDATGKAIDAGFMVGRDYSKADWFAAARDGRFLKSDLLTGTVVEQMNRDPDASRATGRDAYAIGYSAPIMSASGDFIGVWRNLADFTLVEQIVVENQQALAASGWQSAEIVIIDANGLALCEYMPRETGKSEVLHDPSVILKNNLATEGYLSAQAALKGQSGSLAEVDAHTQEEQIVGFARSSGALGYPGLGWSALIRADKSELYADVYFIQRKIYITLIFSALAIFGIGTLVARSITKPILACVGAVQKLAEGNLTANVAIQRQDEIGTLADAINSSIGKLRSLMGQLGQTATNLVGASQSLTETAHSQAAAAEETTVQATTVSAAGEELSVNTNVMSESAAKISHSATDVAKAVAQMSASIQEVSRSCIKESAIANRADQQTGETKKLMAQLDDSAKQISRIVELINTIAEQTKLLALNASIEAASAGEAGRGFAVVAGEVKELARQSASASEDIRRQIALIQQNTTQSVKAIDEVGSVIQEVSQIANSIAAAVEQQSATTTEIARSLQDVSGSTNTLSENVRHSATGAQEVSRNIRSVSDASGEVARGATRISSSAADLDRLASQLKVVVGQFTV
jgi:methyl-accepting chemotaxis protein